MTNTLIVIGIALLASAGQIFLKLGVMQCSSGTAASSTLLRKLVNVLLTPYVFSGLVLYGLCAVAWLWVISREKLSYAYPLLSLTFVFVPLFANMVFGDPIQSKHWIAMGLIVSGVFVLHSKLL